MIKRFKRILLLISMTSLIAVSAIGCGKKDTGVVINAGDNNNDSSLREHELLKEDNSKSTNSNSSDGESTEVTETAQASENNIATDEITQKASACKVSGIWVTDNGDIFQFDSNNSFSGFDAETGENTNGTYESDDETYVKITLSGGYEYTTDENGIEVQTKLDDIVNEYKIVEKKASENGSDASMTIKLGEKELVITKPMDLNIRREEALAEMGTEETVQEKSVNDMTPEELEQFKQNLIEQGIDPEAFINGTWNNGESTEENGAENMTENVENIENVEVTE